MYQRKKVISLMLLCCGIRETKKFIITGRSGHYDPMEKIILSTIAAIGIACFAGGTADAASVKIDEKTFPNACVRTFANKQ